MLKTRMQSKLDVFYVYANRELTACFRFQDKGGSDVHFFCTSDHLYIRPLITVLKRPPFMIKKISFQVLLCLQDILHLLTIKKGMHIPP